MKYVKIAALIILGLSIATFLSFRDYEVTRDPTWPDTIKVYVSPVTNRYRVVDTGDDTTLFYYSVDAFVTPKEYQKVGDKWIVTFEKK